jgi:ERF superfamily
MNLYEKILAVSMEVKNIEKNMSVGSGNYAYKAVSDLDVTLKVKEAEEKFKLVSIPIKQELVSSEVIRTLKDGNKETLTYVDNIKMTLRIVDIEEPTMFIDVESFGKGIDSGDKGFGKASTYARKYALLNAYKIATGEDPDAEKSKQEEVAKQISEKRVAVVNYYKLNSSKEGEICKHFNVPSLDEMTDAQVQLAYTTLAKKNLL